MSATTHSRRFPPPWFVEELEACLVMRAHNGAISRQAAHERRGQADRSRNNGVDKVFTQKAAQRVIGRAAHSRQD